LPPPKKKLKNEHKHNEFEGINILSLKFHRKNREKEYVSQNKRRHCDWNRLLTRVRVNGEVGAWALPVTLAALLLLYFLPPPGGVDAALLLAATLKYDSKRTENPRF